MVHFANCGMAFNFEVIYLQSVHVCLGIAAGLQSGVAKSAFVHPVRALTCEGNGGYGMIMASLDWINLNAIMPAIISMSLGAMASISIDQAITNLMNTKGIFVVSKNFTHDQSTQIHN